MKTEHRRLRKLETANLPAIRLNEVKSFGEVHGEYLAAILCDLADIGATFPACDELRAMKARDVARMAAKTDAEIEADCNTPSRCDEWTAEYINAFLMWDAFRHTAQTWRPRNAEAKLLAAIKSRCDEFIGKSNDEIRLQLEADCELMAREMD